MSVSQNEGKQTTATISIGGKTAEMPVLSGALGPDVIDIRKLPAQLDVFTFDPGYGETAPAPAR